MRSPCGPLLCGDQTSVHVQCEKAWGATQLVLGAEACESDAGSDPAQNPDPEPGSGGCRAAPTAGTGAAIGAAAGLLLALRRKRRSRRMAP